MSLWRTRLPGGLGRSAANLRSLGLLAAAYSRARWLGRASPASVGWTITERCNLQCRCCGVPRSKPRDLPTERVIGIAGKMVDAGTVRVIVNGREPLLRGDLGRVLEIFYVDAINTALATNGYLAPGRTAEPAGLDLCRLSFDGPREVHDRLRGEGAFATAVAALGALRRAGSRSTSTARSMAPIWTPSPGSWSSLEARGCR